MMPSPASDPTADAELDALLHQLETAGLVETYRRLDGGTSCRLTDLGERVGWMLAMHGDDGDLVLEDLLGTSGLAAGRLAPDSPAEEQIRDRST